MPAGRWYTSEATPLISDDSQSSDFRLGYDERVRAVATSRVGEHRVDLAGNSLNLLARVQKQGAQSFCPFGDVVIHLGQLSKHLAGRDDPPIGHRIGDQAPHARKRGWRIVVATTVYVSAGVENEHCLILRSTGEIFPELVEIRDLDPIEKTRCGGIRDRLTVEGREDEANI